MRNGDIETPTKAIRVQTWPTRGGGRTLKGLNNYVISGAKFKPPLWPRNRGTLRYSVLISIFLPIDMVNGLRAAPCLLVSCVFKMIA